MAGPFKMKGFSGFGNSPLKQDEKEPKYTMANDSTTVGNPILDPRNKDAYILGLFNKRQWKSFHKNFEKKVRKDPEHPLHGQGVKAKTSDKKR